MPKFNPLTLNSIGAPQPNYRWVVMLPPLSGYDQTKIYAEKVQLPVAVKIANRPIFFGGFRPKFSDGVDYEDMSIVFYEDQTMSAYDYFVSWRRLVVDDSGNYGVKNTYSLPINVFLFGTLDNTTEVKQWTINNCWPLGIAQYDLAYDQSGRLQTSVSFSADIPTDATSTNASYSANNYNIVSLINNLTSSAQTALNSIQSSNSNNNSNPLDDINATITTTKIS